MTHWRWGQSEAGIIQMAVIFFLLGLATDPDGRILVPLDYWTDLAAYIAAVDTVRASLERQGVIP